MKVILITTIALALAPLCAAAQDDCGEAGECFRAQGCPRCRGSFLLEFSMATSSERCGEGAWFGGEFGYLWNLSPEYGLGGKFFMAGDDCGQRNGFRVVGRRWLTPQLSFEVAPGIAIGGDERQSYPSFSLQVALDIAGVIAPVFNLDMIRPGLPSGWDWAPGYEPPTHWESSLGIRVSSYAVPAALILLIAAFAASGGPMG